MPNNEEVLLDVAVDDGKYRYAQTRGGSHVYRHGEPWRDVTGDGLICAMAGEIDALRERIMELEDTIEGYQCAEQESAA